MSLLRSALRRFGLGLGVALGVLAAIEGALRLRYSREELLFAYERPGPLVRLTDGAPVPQPNGEVSSQDGPYAWVAKHDGRSLRESVETADRAASGHTRMLALGDSWIYGFSVTQGHTLADRLEARVPGLEVVNAAVFGSSAYDMLRRYTDLVDTLHPDTILLGLPHNANRQEAIAAERSSFLRHPLSAPASQARLYLYVRHLLAEWRAPRYAEPPADLEPQAADILAIVRDARGRGLPVYFLLEPARYGGGAPDPHWVELLEPEGVKFAGHLLPERACWGFRDLGHPSEAGVDTLARTLVPVLQGGPGLQAAATEPSCLTSEGVGPGKDGWPVP